MTFLRNKLNTLSNDNLPPAGKGFCDDKDTSMAASDILGVYFFNFVRFSTTAARSELQVTRNHFKSFAEGC